MNENIHCHFFNRVNRDIILVIYLFMTNFLSATVNLLSLILEEARPTGI